MASDKNAVILALKQLMVDSFRIPRWVRWQPHNRDIWKFTIDDAPEHQIIIYFDHPDSTISVSRTRKGEERFWSFPWADPNCHEKALKLLVAWFAKMKKL